MTDNTPITLGLEFESVITSIQDMNHRLKLDIDRNPFIKSVTRDASVESPLGPVGRCSKIFMGSTVLRNKLRKRGEMIAGYEIVTNPLDMVNMRRLITDIVNIQVQMGEIYSPRASVHVHTGFPKGYIFLKTAVALGLKVEPLFYKIAGMGNTFRGETNNANYCRPLALPPAVTLIDSKKVALLNPLKSLDADRYDAFWGTFGGINPQDRERYNPLRYMGINIFSTILRGTMEFRFFNYCSNSRYIQAIAALSQFVSELMLRMSLDSIKSLYNLSIFEKNSNMDYHRILDELISMGAYFDSELPLEKRDEIAIRELIESTPQPVFIDEPVLSHIRRGRISIDDARRYGLTLLDTAKDPGIVDIHTFNASDRKLIG
jgi:hypothetical protein